jgi:hypothetical protein
MAVAMGAGRSGEPELIDPLEVPPGERQQLDIAWMIKGLDTDHPAGKIGIPRLQVAMQGRLGGSWPNQQDLSNVGHRRSDLVEEVAIVVSVTRSGDSRLPMELSLLTLAADLGHISFSRRESDHSSLQVIEPDDGVNR